MTQSFPDQKPGVDQDVELLGSDAVVKSGMENGAAECYDKLSEMLASTPARGASQA